MSARTIALPKFIFGRGRRVVAPAPGGGCGHDHGHGSDESPDEPAAQKREQPEDESDRRGHVEDGRTTSARKARCC